MSTALDGMRELAQTINEVKRDLDTISAIDQIQARWGLVAFNLSSILYRGLVDNRLNRLIVDAIHLSKLFKNVYTDTDFNDFYPLN